MLYGSFESITPAGQIVSGPFPPGTNRPVDMVSDTVTIKNFIGQVQYKTSGTVTFTCSGGGGYGTISGNIQSSGGFDNAINATGTLTVKDGSAITITIS